MNKRGFWNICDRMISDLLNCVEILISILKWNNCRYKKQNISLHIVKGIILLSWEYLKWLISANSSKYNLLENCTFLGNYIV